MNKLYILLFRDWEESNIMGCFSTKDKADALKKYLIDCPPSEDDDNFMMSTLGYWVSKSTPKEYCDHFDIVEYDMDSPIKDITVDNLRYLEWLSSNETR